MEPNLLIVDDVEIVRASIRAIFEDDYNVFEAEDGAQALEQIEKYIFDVILLDLSMPGMNGLEILERIKENKRSRDTPVIVVTTSDRVEDQLEAFRCGVRDYIVKPFVPQLALHRVNNAVNSSLKMRYAKEERKKLKQIAELDLLTGLYNKISSEEKVDAVLADSPERSHALFMFDIDNFKEINDKYGHWRGDQTIKEIADLLAGEFFKRDIVGRIGGDEFIAFMQGVGTEKKAAEKAEELIGSLRNKMHLDIPDEVYLSIGIAFSDMDAPSFRKMYARADKALYEAKALGKNQYVIYQGEKA